MVRVALNNLNTERGQRSWLLILGVAREEADFVADFYKFTHDVGVLNAHASEDKNAECRDHCCDSWNK